MKSIIYSGDLTSITKAAKSSRNKYLTHPFGLSTNGKSIPRRKAITHYPHVRTASIGETANQLNILKELDSNQSCMDKILDCFRCKCC